jgi:hypothetical protein
MSAELSELIAPWIAEQATARQADWARRKAAADAERAAKKTARDADLDKRHARKLGRLRVEPAGS